MIRYKDLKKSTDQKKQKKKEKNWYQYHYI